MAYIEYALLAEYGRIDSSGLVTVVGGSFDRLTIGQLPGVAQLSVVTRVSGVPGDGDISLSIEVHGPADERLVAARVTIQEPADATLLHGRFAVAGAYTFPVPFQAQGVHSVLVQVDEAEDRIKTVLFDVASGSDGEAATG